MVGIGYQGPFIAQADPMHQTAVFLRLILVVKAVTVLRQAAHRNARGQHVHIALNMLMGMLHGGNHIGAGGLIANPPAAGDIHANTIAANEIGIKADNLVVLHQPRPAFLKPRIGARTGGEKACFNPLPAAANIFSM